MNYLDSNRLVAGMVDRQFDILDQLVEHGAPLEAHILRDRSGAQNDEIRSYTRSILEHAAILAGHVGLEACDIGRLHTVPTDEIVPLTHKLNRDPNASAAIHMSPMQGGVFNQAVAVLDPVLNVDRMGPRWSNDGKWSRDHNGLIIADMTPITAQATQRLLVDYGKVGEGTVVAQFGTGLTVGGPLKAILESMGADVRVIPRNVTDDDRRATLDDAEVVIGAVGKGGPLILDDELHDGQTIVGVALSDIDHAVYKSERDILVTPPHLDEAGYWGVGRVTAAGFWERALENAARRAGVRVRLGEHALVGA